MNLNVGWLRSLVVRRVALGGCDRAFGLDEREPGPMRARRAALLAVRHVPLRRAAALRDDHNPRVAPTASRRSRGRGTRRGR